MLIEKEKIGLIQNFTRDPASPTGYTVAYTVCGETRRYPCTQAYWDLHLSEEYIFPLISEVPVVMAFDENGYACGMKRAEPGVDFHGRYGYGCPKGFGYLLSLRDGKLVLDGKRFNALLANNGIAHYGGYAQGSFQPIPDEEVELELTEDVAIYCVDFYGGDRWQKPRDMWYLNDVLKNNKNCYWLNVYDFWNGEGKIDLILMFRQPPKGPDATAGNLGERQVTRQERFYEATGSCYEDEPIQ